MAKEDPRIIIREIFNKSLLASDPYKAVASYSDTIRSAYKSGKFRKLVLIGFGKAASLMSKAIEDNLGDLLSGGIIVTKYGHSVRGDRTSQIITHEAGHPLPDENGLKATKEILGVLKEADRNTLIICLISGGGSSLLVAPFRNITLADKQEVTGVLLKAGADIYELNTVRKHISAVKGGRLAEAAQPAAIISLILSDVIGDRLDMIASGPTAPDKTTYHEALNVLLKYKLEGRLPARVAELIGKGIRGLMPETPKEDDPVFHRVTNIIIGSNKIATDAAGKAAELLGYRTTVLSTELSGESSIVGGELARKAIAFKKALAPGIKACLIAGGETTVTVRGNGKGGRNTELALVFGMAIKGLMGITFLSAGTDGTDGPTDAAGAFVDGQTVAKAAAAGIDAGEYLRNNDSYTFFGRTGDLLITGPTGTNVMDIQIILLDN
ncbi:MAG TPA: glycerate kinase [Dissulfurispiraceae bacterium]|nr:glycerate kinase [Dissulfurispiraceae bacterium]